MSYSPLELQILLEYFAGCKDQNELQKRNEHSKDFDLAGCALCFKKLSLVELRKFLGNTSASERDGLRQLVEVSVSKVSGLAGSFPLTAHQICGNKNVSRGIVLPVRHQIIQFP